MFEVVAKVVINGKEYERVKEAATGYEAVRYRYDNKAGFTSRGCPTVWLDDAPDFIQAILALSRMKAE